MSQMLLVPRIRLIVYIVRQYPYMKNYLLIIGISEFGHRAVDRLLERHLLLKDQYGKSDSFQEGTFSTEKIMNIEDLQSFIGWEVEHLLVVSDAEPESLAIVQKVQNTFKKTFAICVCPQVIETPFFDSFVVVNNQDECLDAVKLFHDFLLIPTLIGVGEEDVWNVCRDRVFQCVRVEKADDYTSERTLFPSSVQMKFSRSKTLMVGIYGNEESGTHVVTEIMKNINASLNGQTKFVFNAFPIEPDLKDKRRVVVIYKSAVSSFETPKVKKLS